MFTVVMKRAKLADTVRTNETKPQAASRVRALCDLHSLDPDKVTYDEASQTYTIDASSYYTEA